MATGALDSNGIWNYGEDDSNATFSALLNRLATSTSDTVTRLENETAAIAPGTTGHPYRQSGGTATTSTSAAVTVTFPASRFTVAPLVHVTTRGGANAVVIPYVASVSAASFTVSLYTTAAARVAQDVSWLATQMTSTTAAG